MKDPKAGGSGTQPKVPGSVPNLTKAIVDHSKVCHFYAQNIV